LHNDATMTGQTKNNDDIYASILSIAKEGASKEEIAQAFSMSYQQLGRLTAELVDRGMLRIDVKKRIFVTTDKAHVFLQNTKDRDI
jgi:predicted transcriptional regulator